MSERNEEDEVPEELRTSLELADDEELYGVVSFFSPDDVEQMGGLPPEAIIGHMEGKGDPVARFRPNEAFTRFMQRLIARRGGEDPALLEAAQQQGRGWLYIVDQRVFKAPAERVPPEDIIGAFRVQGGELVPGSYAASDQHKLFSEKGLVQLPDRLHELLLEELRALAEKSRNAGS